MDTLNTLEALNPLDGRYRNRVEDLAKIFSEKSLMEHRIMVEGEYFIALSEHPEIGLRQFTAEEKELVRRLHSLTIIDARIIKLIELSGSQDRKATQHDVKAVEYYIKDRLKTASLRDVREWIHFALTSEDVTNIAYGLMLSHALGRILVPLLEKLHREIEDRAQEYKDIPMLGRTHEEPASPTTLGKEFKVFAMRLKRQITQLKNHTILVKLNGAVGNYNAHCAAYPTVDWIGFSRTFIERLNKNLVIHLEPNLITTQIESHDTYAELFDIFRRVNTILLDFQQDVRRYISDRWLMLQPRPGEIGSSTMPHKVNPKEFENAKGNLLLSNALFTCFSSELPVSLLQRELYDSTLERNFGTAFGYALVGYTSILAGLGKTRANRRKTIRALKEHPEVVAEAIQTILRREGFDAPYEKVYSALCGRRATAKRIKEFIAKLTVPDTIKEELFALTPERYTGLAARLAEGVE